MRNPLQMGMEPVTISNGKVNEAFESDWNVESPPQYNGVKAEVQVSPTALSFQFTRYQLWPVFWKGYCVLVHLGFLQHANLSDIEHIVFRNYHI